MIVQIFTRYVLNVSFAWNIELSRYTFVWLTFVGAAYVRKHNSHIKIEILFNLINDKLSLPVQKGVWMVKQVLTFAYLGYLIWLGYVLATKSMRFKSQAMQVPQFYLYISVSVGTLMYLFREIQGTFHYYRENFSRKVTTNRQRKEGV